MGDSLPAVNLGAGRTAVEISAGGNFACAILDDGGVKVKHRTITHREKSRSRSQRLSAVGFKTDARHIIQQIDELAVILSLSIDRSILYKI